MNDYKRLLAKMSQRPGVFVGNCSVERIFAFINGYATCASKYGVDLWPESRAFSDFIDKKYDVHVPQTWAAKILFFSSSERNAFENFSKAVKEYLNLSDEDISKLEDF